MQLNLSTENTQPFLGARFSDGLDGPGSIVAAWADLPPVQGASLYCPLLESSADGPGGIALENPPPPVPALVAKAKPASATVKQGGAKTFKIHLTSKDATSPTSVRVCATVPDGLTVKRGKCKTVNGVTATDKTKSFTVKAKRSAKVKRYTLRFKATATGYTKASASAKLKVKRKHRRHRPHHRR